MTVAMETAEAVAVAVAEAMVVAAEALTDEVVALAAEAMAVEAMAAAVPEAVMTCLAKALISRVGISWNWCPLRSSFTTPIPTLPTLIPATWKNIGTQKRSPLSV